MSTLVEPLAKRIAKLLRLLASDFDGEVLKAARRMKQLLPAEQQSFNDIATSITATARLRSASIATQTPRSSLTMTWRRGARKKRKNAKRRRNSMTQSASQRWSDPDE
jgi:hypothetical protein